jgi:hypothetical protein
VASTWVPARSEGEGGTKLFPGTLSNERMLTQWYCSGNQALAIGVAHLAVAIAVVAGLLGNR